MQDPSRLQERHHLIGAPGHSLGELHMYNHSTTDRVYVVAKALLCTLLPPALHYEVLLKETRPTYEQGPTHHGKVTSGPSQERIDTCFQVFGK